MTYALTFSIALGSSNTGLALSAQLVDTAGVNSGAPIATGFTEIGGGNYLWYYGSFNDAFYGGVKFLSGATLKAFAAINPEYNFTSNNVAVVTVVNSGTLSVRRGDRFSQQLTVGTIPADWTKLWLTAKTDINAADTTALFQVLLCNPGVGTDGLQRLNGAVTTAAWGSLTRDDATHVTLMLKENATSLLGETHGVRFDVQVLGTAGGIDTIGAGRVDVETETDVTLAIS